MTVEVVLTMTVTRMITITDGDNDGDSERPPPEMGLGGVKFCMSEWNVVLSTAPMAEASHSVGRGAGSGQGCKDALVTRGFHHDFS